MHPQNPIRGLDNIRNVFNVNPRTLRKRVEEGGVADDRPCVSGQYITPGLRRNGRHYVMDGEFRVPDTSAPVRVAQPKEAHFTVVYMDGKVFTTLAVERGQRPGVTLFEAPECVSGQHAYAVLPLDERMQPLPGWPTPPVLDVPLT